MCQNIRNNIDKIIVIAIQLLPFIITFELDDDKNLFCLWLCYALPPLLYAINIMKHINSQIFCWLRRELFLQFTVEADGKAEREMRLKNNFRNGFSTELHISSGVSIGNTMRPKHTKIGNENSTEKTQTLLVLCGFWFSLYSRLWNKNWKNWKKIEKSSNKKYFSFFLLVLIWDFNVQFTYHDDGALEYWDYSLLNCNRPSIWYLLC